MTAFLFDGHIRNISNLNYSIFITFTISAGLELPSDLLSIICIEQIGRRWSATGSLFLAGVAMAIAGLLLDDIAALVFISMFGRFSITFSINTVLQLNYEIMPTQLRAQGAALSNSLGQMCNIFSPYVVYSVRIHHTCYLNSSQLKLDDFSEPGVQAPSLLHTGRGRPPSGSSRRQPSRDGRPEARGHRGGSGGLWTQPGAMFS